MKPFTFLSRNKLTGFSPEYPTCPKGRSPSVWEFSSCCHTIFVAAIAVAALFFTSDAWAEDGLPAPRAGTVEFGADIKPIFAKHCSECHGDKKQESNFRLDHKPSALRGGEMGVAILPGKSAESPLIRFVAGLDADHKMPPEGERLSSEEIATLRAWIDQGANWPDAHSVTLQDKKRDHWAFKRPVKPAVPTVENSSWAKTPLDHFILAAQVKEGLKPSAMADKGTLLRRLSLDLIGLPPTPEELAAFLDDASPDAYQKQVRRLLASPHYGERWGRHWLDAARYADSDGYEKDKLRSIWQYRDWVINAFNRDLPYNQFVIEQIAGDMLPGATQDQLVATGFLRNSMLNEEGGVDPEQFRMDAMFDRMDAVGKSVLGLTIACCQCHNHKFDPITQEEYYQLFAFLNNAHESSRVAYAPQEQMRISEIRQQMAALEAKLKETYPDWAALQLAWEQETRGKELPWTVLKIANAGDNSQRYAPFADGSLRAEGYAPTLFEGRFSVFSDLAEIRSFRLELLNDPNLPAGGPGRSFKGTAALTEFIVETQSIWDTTQKKTAKFTSATADYSNEDRPLEPNFDDKSKRNRITGTVAYAIDGKDETAWGMDAGPGRRNVPRQAVFATEENLAFDGGTLITFRLVQRHGGWNSDDNMNNNLGRFRISAIADGKAIADPVPPAVRTLLAIDPNQRSPQQAAQVFDYFRTTRADWKELNDAIEQLWKQWPAGSTTLTLAPRDEMRDTAILSRGDWLKPTRKVEANVPASLHPLADPNAPRNRLTFAKWLVDDRSPTTARVIVNRVWQAYFGTGLVSTPEDLGVQSQNPSHPELLDYLAVDLMEHGWSLKHLHELIANSAVYQQSSVVTEELWEKDPLNRWLARAPRLRVEAEVVRDIALQASGLLDSTVGGESIFAPAPAFLFLPPASYGPFTWIDATDKQRYRRAVYTFRRRSTPYPMLQNFDAPNGDASCVRRARSNTPLQALTTLNETIFVECARALALRVLREGGTTDEQRLERLFLLAVARKPSADELAELMQLQNRQQERLQSGELDALMVATGKKDGQLSLPEGSTAQQAAVYTVLARVVLNLDETITRE